MSSLSYSSLSNLVAQLDLEPLVIIVIREFIAVVVVVKEIVAIEGSVVVVVIVEVELGNL
jgi:hypothetical protein